jgi:NMD protein affecting ribosome stability and mRNA decay
MPYGKGRCVTCGKSPAHGKSRCAACLAIRRTADTALRSARRDGRMCLTCGAPAKRGRRHCTTHLAYYRAREASKKKTLRRKA